jgi:hypothetical protein
MSGGENTVPLSQSGLRSHRKPGYPFEEWDEYFRDCSGATGFIPLGQDEVMQGFVDGFRLELHATYPVQDAH